MFKIVDKGSKDCERICKNIIMSPLVIKLSIERLSV